MDDVISRHAAINVIERNRAYIGHNMERAVGAAFIEILNCVGEDIGRLPSIQLATDKNVGTKLGTDLAEVGTDCISRQAAINKILGQPPEPHYPSWYAEQIKELPSAQPKRGKWIKYEQEFMLEGSLGTVQKTVRECSVCTAKIAGMVGIMNFCPNCGADMRGEQDG